MKRIFFVLMLILGVQLSSHAQEDDLLLPPPARKTFYKTICLGNITGMGIGTEYSPAPWIGFGALVGFELPYSPFLAAPYPNNQVAFSLRMRLMHPWGFYATAGWFGGAYEIKRNIGEMTGAKVFYIKAPIAAIGFAWPEQPTDVQIHLEVGGAFGIPEELSTIQYDYLFIYELKAQRSYSSSKSFFPFFGILFTL